MKKKLIFFVILLSVFLCVIALSACNIFSKDQRDTITITFDCNGGKEIDNLQTISGSFINLPIAEKDSYVFVGWSDENNNFYGSTMLVPNKNITLIAIWTEIETNGYGTVTGFQSEIKTATNINIPENLNGEKIIAIADSAFKDMLDIRSVYIPKSVMKIGNEAFSGCYNLQSVTFQENSDLYFIGYYAFYKCSALVDLVVPDKVLDIFENAFEGCISLKKINFPNNMEAISSSICKDCNSLESIEISSSITTINENAFYNCPSLKYIKIKGDFKLNLVENNVFSKSRNFEVVDVGNFDNWCNIQFKNEYSLPYGLNLNLKVNGVEVNTLEIGDNVTQINTTAIKHFDNINNVIVSEFNPVYKSESGCIIKKENNELVYFSNNATLPSCITTLKKGAFA